MYVRRFECVRVHLYVRMSNLMFLKLRGLLFHVVSSLHLFRAHLGVAFSIFTNIVTRQMYLWTPFFS